MVKHASPPRPPGSPRSHRSSRRPRYSGAPCPVKGPVKGMPPRIRPGADKQLKSVFARIGTPDPAPFSPDPFQSEAVDCIGEKDCLVTAPTGAGKTWIAEKAIEKIRQRGGRAWYASPLKALSNSIHIRFSEIFGEAETGILTGDRKENPDAAIIVGTTEILRNHLYDAMQEGRDLGTNLVILDEAHYLGDYDRGVVWEEIMIYLPGRIPLLLLSATIGNAKQISGWLAAIRGRPCEIVMETRRPVPLHPLYLHPTGTLYPLLSGKEGKSRLHPRVLANESGKRPLRFGRPGQLPPFADLLKVLRKYDLLPAIFFLKSRADCDSALSLCRGNPGPGAGRRARIREIIAEAVRKTRHLGGHRQAEALETLGVASHHSGQLPAWKLLVEQLLTEGLLDAVFATSTVAAGVNFPARTILILNSDRFNGTEFLPLTPTEFHQMSGRAGRRGKDKIGFAAVVPGKYMDARLIGRLVHARAGDVTSQIRVNFSMVLNLLPSHRPEEIAALLERSFAAYLRSTENGGDGAFQAGGNASAGFPPDSGKDARPGIDRADQTGLAGDFFHHYYFLMETGYVDEAGRLTEDGVWASRLRVDQPLLIAEALKNGLLPGDDPRMLAAMIAAFVNERESVDRFRDTAVPNQVKKNFHKMVKGIRPFQDRMFSGGFPVRTLYLRPAVSVFLWASGLWPWDKVVTISETAEGDLAMLILRTADHLRHLIALKDVFPEAAGAAGTALDALLREPVAGF